MEKRVKDIKVIYHILLSFFLLLFLVLIFTFLANFQYFILIFGVDASLWQIVVSSPLMLESLLL